MYMLSDSKVKKALEISQSGIKEDKRIRMPENNTFQAGFLHKIKSVH